MEKQMPVWASVAVVALVSALLLVSTHLATQVFAPPEGALGKDTPQGEALPAAELFVPVEIGADSGVDSCYQGKAGDQMVGYAAQVTVKGYGGPIEVVVGMDMNGLLTGVSIGGAQFGETPGLGAKAKEPEFKNQFAGIGTPVGLNKSDATSAATASGDWTTPAPEGDATSAATTSGDWTTPAPEGDTTSAATTSGDWTTPEPDAGAAPEAAVATVDAISGATITSTAVVNGVNLCAEFIKTLLASGNG